MAEDFWESVDGYGEEVRQSGKEMAESDPSMTRHLNEAIHTMTEGSQWPDDVSVSEEQAFTVIALWERLKKDGGFPEELIP